MNILYVIWNPFQSALHNNSAFLDSLSQNIVILLGKRLLILYSDYICYDDGCHLRKFARNPIRKDLTPTSKKIASLEIVVDKMHMAGHVDKWCMANCDPRNIAELNDVSTQTCVASVFHSCYYSVVYKLLFNSSGWYGNLWTNLFMVIKVRKNHQENEQSSFYVLSVIHLWSAQPERGVKAEELGF